MSIVDVQHLSKRYPSFELSDVSFCVGAGRITGFIGRNDTIRITDRIERFLRFLLKNERKRSS